MNIKRHLKQIIFTVLLGSLFLVMSNQIKAGEYYDAESGDTYSVVLEKHEITLKEHGYEFDVKCNIKKNGKDYDYLFSLGADVSIDNTSIATISAGSRDIRAYKVGVTYLRVSYKGASDVMKITVVPNTVKGELLSQVGTEAGTHTTGVRIKPNGDYYKIYRSKKIGGPYKCVGTVEGGEELWNGNDYVVFKDKKLKANTKYYYKVAAKLDQSDYYGEMSAPKVFWTTLPRYAKKVKQNGRKVTWKKTKGAHGYTVWESWVVKRGYNIFGQLLVVGHNEIYTVRGTKYRIKNKPAEIEMVLPYTKHGNYCYADGKEVKTYKKFKKHFSLTVS